MKTTPCRIAAFLVCLAVPSPVAAQASTTLVLPLRTVGIDAATATVSRDLLEHELQDRGLDVVSLRSLETPFAEGEDACDEPECAGAAGRDAGVDQVVYGSLSRLGGEIIVRVYVLRGGENTPSFKEQLSAAYEEELDTLMERMADGIAAGRPDAERATVKTVIQEEARPSLRRAMRPGVSVQFGLLTPTGDSYGRENRLTSFQLMLKFEGPSYLIETVPITGFSWGDRVLDWTILDAFAARIFGLGDFAPFAGAGFGIHYLAPDKDDFADENTDPVGVAVLCVDVGVGLLAMRTWDVNFMVEARFRHAFDDFSEVGGGGADGLSVTFGLGR